MSFDGKTVLVTGGTSGIGLAAAQLFAAGGADVIVSGRDAERGAQAVSAIESAGHRARYISADLSQPGAARELAGQAGAVDVLVNNAGVFPGGPTHEVSDETVRTVLDVNVLAPFALAAELIPGMVERGGGSVVNISTMVASFGLPGMSIYGASKAALESLTKFWAAEYSGSGVRVNAVAPGPVTTPGTAEMPAEAIAFIESTVPQKRSAAPEEIAAAIVFLASDEASFITGATLAADGGRTAV
jgi:NAD(P)-dependent dehydrogenase (short-subunit alcohol dehydrogenase family)